MLSKPMECGTPRQTGELASGGGGACGDRQGAGRNAQQALGLEVIHTAIGTLRFSEQIDWAGKPSYANASLGKRSRSLARIDVPPLSSTGLNESFPVM